MGLLEPADSKPNPKAKPVLTMESAALRTVDLLTPRMDRRLIALAGLPGSGKSTFARELANRVNKLLGESAAIPLSMDGFHLSRAELHKMPNAEELIARRGAPWTFDVAGLATRIRRLREAEIGSNVETMVEWPDFQHDVGDPAEGAIQIARDSRFILIEGLYLLMETDGWGEVHNLFDESWYLDTPMEISMARLARRHMTTWNVTREAAEQQIARNDRLNAELVLNTRDAADCFIRASTPNYEHDTAGIVAI